MPEKYIDIRFKAVIEVETYDDETYSHVAKLTPVVKKVKGLDSGDLMSIYESMGQMDSWQEMLTTDVPHAIAVQMQKMDD